MGKSKVKRKVVNTDSPAKEDSGAGNQTELAKDATTSAARYYPGSHWKTSLKHSSSVLFFADPLLAQLRPSYSCRQLVMFIPCMDGVRR